MQECKGFLHHDYTGDEVDVVIEKHGTVIAGCEVKSSPTVVGANLTGLRSFAEDHPSAQRVVISTTENGYRIGDVLVLPWREFFVRLKEWV